MFKQWSRGAWLLLLPTLFLIPQDAHANFIIPEYSLLAGPLMFLLYIPVVLIEAVVFKLWLPKISYKMFVRANAYTNAFTLILGIPLCWILSFRSLFAGAMTQLVQILVLGLLYFMLSAWVETELMQTKYFPKLDRKVVRKITWLANLASYAFLYGIMLWYMEIKTIFN